MILFPISREMISDEITAIADLKEMYVNIPDPGTFNSCRYLNK